VRGAEEGARGPGVAGVRVCSESEAEGGLQPAVVRCCGLNWMGCQGGSLGDCSSFDWRFLPQDNNMLDC
jgi:hypothetical protein